MTNLIEIPSESFIKIPEGYEEDIANEIQVIIAVAIVIIIKSTIIYGINTFKRFNIFLIGKNNWKLEREIKIKDIITELLFILKADRVILSHFVNGEITASGMPLKKLKVTFEKTALGVTSARNELPVEISVTKILTQIEELKKANDWVFVVTRFLPEGLCRAYLSSLAVKSQAEKLLVKNDIPIAILTIQYIKDEVILDKEVFTNNSEIQDLLSRLLALA